MRVHNVLTFGQLLKMNEPAIEPFPVWLFTGEFGFDLVIFDDAALGSIHEEHTPWLESSLADHFRLVDVQHSSFGRQHDETIICDPETSWTKTIAVQHSTYLSAICETNVCRTIPWFHQSRVELIEGAALRIHIWVVFPRFGNHHQYGLRQ